MSGIEIMKSGLKQVIENDSLKIFDGNELVATGHYNDDVGLIQMDNDVVNQSSNGVSFEQVHCRFGHIGNSSLVKTLKAVDGLETVKIPSKAKHCQDCQVAKSKKSSTVKARTTERQILEVIESDTQGPFRLVAIDGTKNNVKFIDQKSGYIKMETIQNREASTIYEAFKRFKTRMERRTGKIFGNG